jgi:hypothetical protein
MRRCAGALTAALALTLCVTADGPGRGAAQMFIPGSRPRDTSIHPFDPKLIVPGADFNKFFPPPQPPSRSFSLANLFRGSPQPRVQPARIPTRPRAPGQNPLPLRPPQGQLVTTPTPAASGSKNVFDFLLSPFK